MGTSFRQRGVTLNTRLAVWMVVVMVLYGESLVQTGARQQCLVVFVNSCMRRILGLR